VTQKVCFLLRIDPISIDEYVRRHRDIWPEMMRALVSCGYRNYSIFVDVDGLLVGYLETDDFAESSRLMAGTDVQQAWNEYMGSLFRDVDADRPVGTVTPLMQAFDLDEQSARWLA
jgi:L-rhamnose mutarotase